VAQLGYDHNAGQDLINATLPLGFRGTVAVDHALASLYDAE
jgi:hypothetical protein